MLISRNRFVVFLFVYSYLSWTRATSRRFNNPSGYIEPQDMAVPRSWNEVPGYFGKIPRLISDVRVYSSGYHIEQEFHTPKRSYGFGIEDRRVLERSSISRADDTPIVVQRPFESRIEIHPLTGRIVQYGPSSPQTH